MLLTTNGLYNLDGSQIDTPFSGRLVHHGHQYGKSPVIIVDRKEVWIKEKEWTKLLDSELTLNCMDVIGDKIFVGTENARVAQVNNGKLEFIETFDQLENRDEWWTPWGGPPDVRSLASSTDGTLYADIHVGWIARSEDAGMTWTPVTTGLHQDVHQVETHQTDSQIVIAATAGGFHISFDKGRHFEKRWSQRQTYQRAVLSVGDEQYLASVSSGPGGNQAKLYFTEDSGQDWQQVEGLPDNISNNINTYQLSIDDQGAVYVIVDNKSLYSSEDDGRTWELVISELPKAYQML